MRANMYKKDLWNWFLKIILLIQKKKKKKKKSQKEIIMIICSDVNWFDENWFENIYQHTNISHLKHLKGFDELLSLF
jgi:hypothetical protein